MHCIAYKTCDITSPAFYKQSRTIAVEETYLWKLYMHIYAVIMDLHYIFPSYNFLLLDVSELTNNYKQLATKQHPNICYYYHEINRD